MSRHVTFMTIDDAAHYSPAERAAIVAAYPAHEREARAKGIPVLGSGRIFPVAEELIACEPFRLPRYWPRLGALDFGWDHPSAAVELAWDTEAAVIYVTNTHQPSQDVRGMHRHRLGGVFGDTGWAVVESAAVTPGQDGNDDLWLVVKRTIGGVTKRYIEIKTAPFEYGSVADAFEVDCGLTYAGTAVTSVGGAAHLAGQSVDVLADGKVYRGLTVSGGGTVTLPGGASAARWQLGLPYAASADTLELDVGGRDGSLIGRRKKVAKAILSLFETDTTGLEVQSLMRGRWEPVRMPSIVMPDGGATLFTGNVEVPIDDSWEGQGRVRIRHVNPTPCTIRAFTPVFDAEP